VSQCRPHRVVNVNVLSSCYTNGSLALLFLPISRHSQNIIRSPSHTASISIWSEPTPKASRARVSLMGNVTVFEDDAQIGDIEALQKCYLQSHPDARSWLPESPRAPHISYWARFDPHVRSSFGQRSLAKQLTVAINRPCTTSAALESEFNHITILRSMN
jgi:hypothetical protein